MIETGVGGVAVAYGDRGRERDRREGEMSKFRIVFARYFKWMQGISNKVLHLHSRR